jgi:hypothetical protein
MSVIELRFQYVENTGDWNNRYDDDNQRHERDWNNWIELLRKTVKQSNRENSNKRGKRIP